MASISETVLLDMIVTTCKTKEDAIDFISNTVFDDWLRLLENICKPSQQQIQLLLKTIEVLATKVISNEGLSPQLEQSLTKILLTTCTNAKFINLLAGAVTYIYQSENNSIVFLQHLSYIEIFCQVVLEKNPTTGTNTLAYLIHTCVALINSSAATKNANENLFEKFTYLQKQCNETSKLSAGKTKSTQSSAQFSEEVEYHLHTLEPPEDFRDLSVIPKLNELVNEKSPFLRPNKTLGAYKNVDHYLDVHFRLLREDFFRPLRRSIQGLVQNRDEFLKNAGKCKAHRLQESGVRVYTDVIFHGTETMAYDNTTHHIFCMPYTRINWAKTKRLMPGCLVVLTFDFCKTAIFAITVAPPFDPKNRNQNEGFGFARRELAEGKLRVSIEGGQRNFKKGKPFIMLECEAFFEAYRHVLANLQNLQFARSSLAKFLVEVCPDVDYPIYLDGAKSSKYQFKFAKGDNFKADAKAPETWENEIIQRQLCLDENQFVALKTALTKELAVIQGPPGTGKTYVGLQIVKQILENMKPGPIPNSPLLVLCYTNHALDQFLELLLKEIPLVNVVRVGGQSKSDLVKAYAFAEHRKKIKSLNSGWSSPYAKSSPNLDRLTYSHLTQNQAGQEADALTRVKNLESASKKLQAEIDEMMNPDGIFHFSEMLAGRQLRSVLPFKLWETFQKMCWMKLEAYNFSSSDFDVAKTIAEIFEIKSSKTLASLEKNAQANTRGSNSKTLKTQKAKAYPAPYGNLDYELEELLEHTLVDIDSPWDSRLSDGVFYHVQKIYVERCSVRKCKEMINRAATRFRRDFIIKGSPRKFLKQAHAEFVEIKTENENRANFFTTLFQLYKQKRLELPDVAEYINMTPSTNENSNSEDCDTENETDGYEFDFGDCDMATLPLKFRWAIYFKVVEMAIYLAQVGKDEITSKLPGARDEYKEQKHLLDVSILKHCDIIGMTTTGAAKTYNLLEKAKPEIVIVEEAAEILEAHIVTALTNECKQLILIGDHFQLRPGANVYELWGKYRLNVSLFERMILNGVPFCTLKTQHRMRPEIADLIVGPIYEELYNHEKVSKYPEIKGVTKSMYFINHRKPEQTDMDLMSKSNHHEAAFLIALCDYLLKQGYLSTQITILTTYTGQMFLLKKLVPPTWKPVLITCVDNFQGEENDIILLSLVRSNPAGQVGFVGIANRICVALSRARHGLFVIGNMDGMANASSTWTEIVNKLKASGGIGSCLELICERHQNVTRAQCDSDFAPLEYGGCAEMCGYPLPCQHLCAYLCHARNQKHENFKCIQRCNKLCPLNHLCIAPCFAPCPPCKVPIYRKLPCEHIMCVPCFMKPSDIKCMWTVERTLPCEFRHNVELHCYIDINTFQCPVLIERVLPCNHNQVLECGLPLDQAKCPVLVDKTLNCGHIGNMKCSRPMELFNCNVKVEKVLPCGHEKTVKCHKSVGEVHCAVEVEIVMPDCFHVQKIVCCNQATHKCREKCDQVLSCKHVCRLVCHMNKDPFHKQYKCKFQCDRVCDLGHPCKYVHSCFKLCSPCETPITVVLQCGHEIEIECGDKMRNPACSKSVRKKLPCGHENTVPCHADVDKQKCNLMILYCQKQCDYGHKCQSDHICHESCPPCRAQVKRKLECGHSLITTCSENPENYKCTETVYQKRKSCKHKVAARCGQSILELAACKKCPNKALKATVELESKSLKPVLPSTMVEVAMPCGHNQILSLEESTQIKKCFVTIFNCKRECEQGHNCNSQHLCGDPCPPCLTRVEKTLDCGHEITSFCSEHWDDFKCKENVRTNCKMCSCQLSVKCYELESAMCQSCSNGKPNNSSKTDASERETRSECRGSKDRKSRQKSKARQNSVGPKKKGKGKKK